MIIEKQKIAEHNQHYVKDHTCLFNHVSEILTSKGINVNDLLTKISKFQVAIPSWALGAGGTRFGRFSIGGEPRCLEEKIEDIGLIHALNRSSNAISLHIPWDIPKDAKAIIELLKKFELKLDSVNSNTFQDQKKQKYSYKYGSLCHTDKAVRDQAIEHNLEVVKHGVNLGAKMLTIWLADGSNFPGQQNLRKAFENTNDSIQKIYKGMPSDWAMLIEYKPFEPNFYSMVISDWGTSYLLCSEAGERANVLVDLGHHLPNANIEQIVARLMLKGRLGGFHFNDSKYGDDDLTTGSLKPYQLYLIFNEIIDAWNDKTVKNPDIAWMIDASHTIKDPLEDLLQSVEAILVAYTQALLVDRNALHEAQQNNDVVMTQEILQDAFRLDVRPLIAQNRMNNNGALYPLKLYRDFNVRSHLIETRGTQTSASGL